MKFRYSHHKDKAAGAALLLFAGLCVTACAGSSPMQSRLNKNFVFNCSLELIKKDVPPADAERICSASHRGELQESEAAAARDPREYRQPQQVAPAPETAKAPARAPASAPEAPPAPAAAPSAAPAASSAADLADPVAPGSH